MEHRIVMLGSGGVGKSAISLMFIKGEFVERYDPTIEDAYRKAIQIDNERVNIDLLDTAGQEEFTALRDTYMRTGQGFIIVYSVIDPSSFHEADEIFAQLLRTKDADRLPVVIAANKCDCVNDRSVTTKEGQMLAKKYGATYLEVSARNFTLVLSCFEEVVRAINSSGDEGESKCFEEPIHQKAVTVSKKTKRKCTVM
ncbi:Ras-related protein Rap [Acrasis kona]|uniref:small monomeric GTPase n=1 Tax=Acrasis kona TaxID=1008807 RepID=A0AAW2YUR1_9EUKA